MNTNNDKDLVSGFSQFYDENANLMFNNTDYYEEKRNSSLYLTFFSCIILLPCLAVAIFKVFSYLIINNITNDFLLNIVFFIIAIISVFVFGMIFKPATTFNEDIKSTAISIIMKYLKKDFSYINVNQSFIENLKECAMLPHYTEAISSNYIVGTYKNVKIELSEAKFTSRAGRNELVAFNGFLILLNMNKNFHGNTFIVNNRNKNFFTKWLNTAESKKWFKENLKKITNATLETINLEDPIFRKEFIVFSTDQVESRYLLTTSFMERLINLNKLLGSHGLQCSFYNNKILIMINSKKDLFSTSSIFRRVDVKKDCTNILLRMNEIFHIIDILGLDKKTGL